MPSCLVEWRGLMAIEIQTTSLASSYINKVLSCYSLSHNNAYAIPFDLVVTDAIPVVVKGRSMYFTMGYAFLAKWFIV